ncbi:NCS2 family permease [Bartonella sp. HY329]|uniref:NCS2 family permease n=1 Tax=unclassified Bartonella TaxID=2645622 RepID=UPI0021C9F022|nr:MULTISPECIES: NCS2 family permease [unclassified Bartonella]UXM94736.1 NCS2 family permease [Bartonella sp. HY329]UXN09059.1 NCS2 family permease [Bartonella sp. HY328]
MLEKLFGLSRNGTTVKTEILAGLTTFLTMSYILAVNPNILADTGMDRGAVFVATCIAAIIGSLIMGFIANWPIGMAPGMGLNAFFAFVVTQLGFTWQQALGAVFISGVIFIVLSASGIRRWLIDGVPQSLRSAIAAGIGLFLIIVALKTSGVLLPNKSTDPKNDLLILLGDLKSVSVLLTGLGFFLIIILDHFRFRGAVLTSILVITIISMLMGISQFNGVVSLPSSLAPTFLQLDLMGVFQKGFFYILLVFVLVEVFDATGTLIGVGTRAGLIVPNKPNNLDKALFADSTAIVAGSLLGTSSTTAYVESAAGAAVGGRTGLTAITVACFFAVALFFSPLATSIPAHATAPALLFVGCLMVREFAKVNWNDLIEAVPAILTAIMMPLTYSIANGLAFGFISYVVLKTSTGKWRDVHPATWVIGALFILRFVIE